MAEQIIGNHQIISTNHLIRALKEGRTNSERFCFIIGSGASVSSGIPTGATLEYRWMAELEADLGLEGIREIAKNLTDHLESDFAVIEKNWKKAKKSGYSLSSEYYFDIYKLRFYPNHRNGYHYLEKVMANAHPGFGYHPLALMLTDGTGSNLVITTNFDSLIEDALFLYTDDKPLVINHELLADYAGDSNIKRPIIAKVHRGIFFDPLNQPEDTNELKGNWRDVLGSVFQIYTPIVIGYGGGDKSLMNLLENDDVKMKNGLYWCYFEKYGLPSEKIQSLVKNKNGYLVRTAGFDAAMLAIGNALFPDKIGVHETEEYLNRRTNVQIANYEEEYKKLTECEETKEDAFVKEPNIQSENEFKKEIEKMVERSTASQKKRQDLDQMTAWDYRRQGNRYYELKEYEKAIESYTNALRIQSNTAQFYNDRGCVYIDLKKYDAAISDFDKAIELNLEDTSVYSNRGCAYNSLEEYEKAISDLDKAIELDPTNTSAYNNYGYTYINLKEYSKAIPYLDKALELDPENKFAYNNRGTAYIFLKDYNKAAYDLGKAIELDPEYPFSYKNMGILWKEKADLDKAIKFLTKAIELDSSFKQAYIERAEVYRLLKEPSKAMADEAMAEKL